MTQTSSALPPEETLADWRTLREIDQRLHRAKGTAFRAFRAMAEGGSCPSAAGWHEGRHFCLVRRHEHPRRFASLGPRLYPGTLTAILLSPTMVSALERLA